TLLNSRSGPNSLRGITLMPLDSTIKHRDPAGRARDRKIRLSPSVLPTLRAREFGLAVHGDFRSRSMRGLQIQSPSRRGELGESFRERTIGDDVVHHLLSGLLAADHAGR